MFENMARYIIAICTLMACMVLAKSQLHPPSSAPSPTGATDCSTLIFNMAACTTFIGVGGADTTPSSDCCSGFKTVLVANPICICEGLKSSASMGIAINFTRAAVLPSLCKLSAPPISRCNITLPPGVAPVPPPPTPTPGPVTPANPPTSPPTSPPTIPPPNVPPPTVQPPKVPSPISPTPSGGSTPSPDLPVPSPPIAPVKPPPTPPSEAPSSDGDGGSKPSPGPAVSSGIYNVPACCFTVMIISMLVAAASFSFISV